MLDLMEYSTPDDHHQGNGSNGNGNGYSHLTGDWALFYKVASGFTRRVRPEDKQDFLHDLLLTMAQVKAKYQTIGKELTEAGLVRVACYDVAQYWREKFKRFHGTDCGRCNQEQRRKCQDNDLYRQCPKAVKVESLDRLVEDGEGGSTGLHQMIADDNAVDIVAMLDAKFALQSYPRQAVMIAFKRWAGYPLDDREQNYLSRFRKRLKQRLFS